LVFQYLLKNIRGKILVGTLAKMTGLQLWCHELPATLESVEQFKNTKYFIKLMQAEKKQSDI
jgi:hypothetical protein